MCGIAGLIMEEADGEPLLRRMASALAHRGPDDHGFWIDAESGIGLAHRRLSIVDLSPAGHQPMVSQDGRWVLTFNGEIYNHAELRAGLEAEVMAPRAFRGHSDTETLIEAIALWGLEAALERSVGMFALALWDRRERRLFLARDRFGEKPLYFGWVGGRFAFASELKALRALPGFDNRIDRRALGLYTRLGYVPAPFSIFERVFKLEPGCLLSSDVAGLLVPRSAAPTDLIRNWWSYAEVVAAGRADPILDEREAEERLEQALRAAVKRQAMADVPVGAFLSGGIDSSIVVALCREQMPVRTFTVGFEESSFDEAPYARRVAAHLGTEHIESRVTAVDAREVIPLLPAIYDEPFADSSQIPTYLICRHARRDVKVALSGDGGDELFGGYNRHLSAPRAWDALAGLPGSARAAAGGLLGRVPAAFWDRSVRLFGQARHPQFGAKVSQALRTFGRAGSIDDLYESFVDSWHGEKGPVEGRLDEWLDRSELRELPSAERLMYLDATTYLPDDILCKVDRAAMAVSLETRLPLLDHRVAELSARIPVGMKISGGIGKQVLRRILYRHVPRELFDRPKAGFAIPIGEWLGGPLRDWAETLLDPAKLAESGFDPAPIGRRWRAHLAGERDFSTSLWAVLVFQAWRSAPADQVVG